LPGGGGASPDGGGAGDGESGWITVSSGSAGRGSGGSDDFAVTVAGGISGFASAAAEWAGGVTGRVAGVVRAGLGVESKELNENNTIGAPTFDGAGWPSAAQAGTASTKAVVAPLKSGVKRLRPIVRSFKPLPNSPSKLDLAP
jgi:hypothetical protein